ncbi:MAG: Rhodopirellula transposase domain [Gemmataceae bacterium]|nr:Rhodopirellula transposase domain [Gemmataceae bacterium]
MIWTPLTATDLAAQLTARGHPVSTHIVDHLPAAHACRRRKAQKSLPRREQEDRDEQFVTTARWTREYLDRGTRS